MKTGYNVIAGRSLERLAALSDGIFAVAMTLLVLDIRAPAMDQVHNETDLCRALVALLPRFLMYLMSFLSLGIFWTGQQTQFNNLSRADRHFSWIQIAFLAAVSIMPFSTSLLAAFIDYRTALITYWMNILVLGGALYAGWRYARGTGLVKAEVSIETICAVERRILVGQSLYAFGAVLSTFNTYWSIGFIVLVQLNYAVAPRIRLLEKVRLTLFSSFLL
jgi:uncharacterized membrane protein